MIKPYLSTQHTLITHQYESMLLPQSTFFFTLYRNIFIIFFVNATSHKVTLYI